MTNFVSGTALTAAALNTAFNQLSINTQAGAYTLVLADQGGGVMVNSTSANALTIPPNSSVAFPVGTTVVVAALNTGITTLTPGVGVTIVGTPGLKLRTRYSGATCIQTSANTWLALGDLSA